MEKDLISIVVPIYNVEKYLKQCLDSIINQSYRNLEIILIDDGSPDNCGKICNEYAQKDNRIKTIHKENGGLSDARNCGIVIAKGKYITFVDSDDYIEPQYVEKLYDAIQANNTKMSQCNILIVNDNGEMLEKTGYENILIKKGKEILQELYGEHWIENVVAWNKMYEIELFKDLRYPIGKIHEDEFTTYKILYNVDKVAIVDDYLYNYRKNENSITERKFNLKRLDMLEAFEERMEFFEEKNEKYLYELTQRQYLYTVIDNYRKILQNIENSKDTLKMVLAKYRQEYRNARTNKVITKKDRLKLTMCYYYPQVFFLIQDIKGGLSERIRFIKKYKEAVYKYKKYKKQCSKNNKTEFIIFNTPIHGNIGDQAIIYAEQKMLERLNINAFEIPTYEEKYYFDYIKRNIHKEATISITGGGFIGSQWLEEEELVNKVIQNFKKHRIIIFPSTFYFKDDEQGRKELEKSIKIINDAQNINIFARETKTYEFIKNTYPNAKVNLVPDIVLSLDKKVNDNSERKGILLCFRKDVEGILSEKDIRNLVNKISNYDRKIKKTDTIIDYDIRQENRDKEIKTKLEEFASSKMVITDRLHGMIFAVITNTPCLVFGNYNYKVKGVYEDWIKNKISNVIFVENIDEIEVNIEKLTKFEYEQYIDFDFKDLISVLEEI